MQDARFHAYRHVDRAEKAGEEAAARAEALVVEDVLPWGKGRHCFCL